MAKTCSCLVGYPACKVTYFVNSICSSPINPLGRWDGTYLMLFTSSWFHSLTTCPYPTRSASPSPRCDINTNRTSIDSPKILREPKFPCFEEGLIMSLRLVLLHWADSAWFRISYQNRVTIYKNHFPQSSCLEGTILIGHARRRKRVKISNWSFAL